jgi:AcrR family transcriptional regulator
MATELEDRAQRIVDSAIELAEKGGFEAVRLRDVAAHADVALGTLYRRFRSKEDLLVAALDREMSGLEDQVLANLPKGDTHLDRLTGFFTRITRNFCRKPNLARALLKALVSGDPALAHQVAGFHSRLERLIVASLRGAAPTEEEPPSDAEKQLAWNMDLIWYALILSWSSGVRTQAAVIAETRDAAELMIEGWNGAAR